MIKNKVSAYLPCQFWRECIAIPNIHGRVRWWSFVMDEMRSVESMTKLQHRKRPWIDLSCNSNGNKENKRKSKESMTDSVIGLKAIKTGRLFRSSKVATPSDGSAAYGKPLNCPVTSQYPRAAGAHTPACILSIFVDAYKKQYICERFDNSQITLRLDVSIKLVWATLPSLNAVERRTLRHLSCLLRWRHWRHQ